MDNEEFNALRKRIRDLRTEAKAARSVGVPAGVQVLRDLLRRTVADEDYVALTGLLLSEYAFFRMHDQEELLLRGQIERFPNKPIPQIALADFLVSRQDFKQASRVVEGAIRAALADGNFVRDAYNCRARLAITTEDYGLLEDTLEKLIEYHPIAGSQNVRCETDFLSDLPEDAVNPEVLREYLRVCKRNRQGG